MAFSTTLTADLGAGDLLAAVTSNSGARTVYPWRATLGSEIVYVTGGVKEGLDWSILRGADGTDAAEHLMGATLTASPPSATVFVSATDPGAVGPRNLWLDTAVYPRWWVRNAADDGWETAGLPGWSDSDEGLISSPADNAEIGLKDAAASYWYTTHADGVKIYRIGGGGQINVDSDGFRANAQGVGGSLLIAATGIHIGQFGSSSAFATDPILVSGVGTDPPWFGTGWPAPVGSGALLDNGIAQGEAYLKTGAADTEWTRIGTQAAAVADLGQTITNPPTQTEVQDISDKVDELLAALRTSSSLAT